MNFLLRQSLYFLESAVYGFSYGALMGLIRQPKPLDPEWTWKLITRKLPRFIDWWRVNYPPKFARRMLLAAKMKQDHLLGISAHYDVSNDFYELFLDDKYMFYSCADFNRGDETLKEAQTAKADFICDLIDPKPGERILDLGCGWGPMMRRVNESTGDATNLCGYTLSEEQRKYIEQHDGFNVELRNFITCDYEECEFDKIYSIGAWEHVRHRDLPVVLGKLFKALKPGGRMVKHFFCPLTETVPVAAVVGQIFFPGSFIPAYATQKAAFEAAGFQITHQSIHDYRPTLRAWFDNLAKNRERAIELVGVRDYNKYLVFFPASWRHFDDGESMLVRFVLEKPDSPLPDPPHQREGTSA
jgi:cyclopropane-fatty-acyl-phospholipid synthase